MNEDHPPRKSWVQQLLRRSHPDYHLSDEGNRRATNASEPSLNPTLQIGSGEGRRGSLHHMWRKMRNTRHTPSTGQSPHPAPTPPQSSVQDHSSDRPSSDPPPQTDLASGANLVQAANSGDNKSEPPDPKERIKDANKATAGMKDCSGNIPNIPAVTTDMQSGLETVDTISELPDPKERIGDATTAIASLKDFSGVVPHVASAQSGLDTVNTVSSFIASLKAFNSIAKEITNIHPYAKGVLSIFIYASKMILDQADRDNAVQDLLQKLSEVYTFMKEDERLAEIQTMQALYGKVARQTLECADFIVHYSETKSAWKRLGKNVFGETTAMIQSYNDVLDTLIQHCRDQAVRKIVVDVHEIDRAVRDIGVNINNMAEDLDFKDMVYVDGAGRDTSKCCIPGTREHILSEIETWVDDTGEDVKRVFWLCGTAGKGKSAIAHTIAHWFHDRGGAGAFFCFDCTRGAERRHEKIFTTIARDIADGDPIIRRALTGVVRKDNELRHTKDITRQWKQFILGPLDAASKAVTAPILVVIDALDESGGARSREQILRVLSGKLDNFSSDLTKFPANIRVLVTSRPLGDIHDHLHGTPHVRHVSMDDNAHVSSESANRDIERYISTQLEGLRVFNKADFKRLALKSDGLFEWARLACEYIKGTNKMSKPPKACFDAVIAGASGKGTHLLDNMYGRILEEIIPQDELEEEISVFRSVMRQLLASLEPLPITALTVMRQHFPLGSDRYEVDDIIRPLGSLLTGTTDPDTPVRPLHASFYDFLTDKARSKVFFIDVSSAQRHLAFASLRVMEHELRFNMCSLENSYLPNSKIPDLDERVKKSISDELSYSCRFWGTHVNATVIEPLLCDEVRAFFDGDHLLFWLEAVSLLNCVGGSVGTLLCIARWLTGHAQYTDLADTVSDALRFVRTFAPAILHSTPHLYLSALPLAPMESRISKKFIAKFPRTPRVVAGHVMHWPQMEKTIHLCSQAHTVAISPDGRHIVCGSANGMIHVRDMETGEALCAPLVGHTEKVFSVAISPNGNRIVSGSVDTTIRVWDAGTGKPLGAPLQGHTDTVTSVAISLDGNRIVSGSADMTIMVWDIDTGKALGAPIRGHTDAVWSVAISPSGNRIVSGSDDKTIRMWDMDTGNALGAPLEGHMSGVLSVAISPDGNRIISGSFDNTIRIWDVITSKPVGVPLRGHIRYVHAVAISPDGNSIVSGSYDATIRIWDARTGDALGMPLQGHAAPVMSVAISRDGSEIVSCSMDFSIRVWDADTSRTLGAPLQGHTSLIAAVIVSQDGNQIVSGSGDSTIMVWDAHTGKALSAPLKGHTAVVWCVAISSDGNLIVSGSSDQTIRIWDAMTGKALIAPLQGHTDAVISVAVSFDGNLIVSGSRDTTIRVWDTCTGDILVQPLQGHTGYVNSVAISLDGNLIVSGSGDRTIRMWNTVTGHVLGAPLQGHTSDVLSVAISLDGRQIVSGSADKMIRIWDIATGETLGVPLQGHTDQVWCVAISQDGNLIASCSEDKTIRVWDAMTGKEMGAPLRGHTETVRSIAISPDRSYMVSGSWDKMIRVWDLESFTRAQFSEMPAIHFSSNPTHALRSTSSFLQDLCTPISPVPTEDGWIVGPEGRLLLWIPTPLYPALYAPGNALVIPGCLQLDLSCFAHGTSWEKCREHNGAV